MKKLFSFLIIGSFLSVFLIPNASFAATPAISYSGSGMPFSSLTVQGSGFEQEEQVTVQIGSRVLGTVQADGGGNFLYSSFTVPNLITGKSYALLGIGAKDSVAMSYLYVPKFYPMIAPSSYYIQPGKQISLGGTGFAPNENITITLGSATSNTTTDASGNFVVTGLTIPFGGSSVNLTAQGDKSNSPISVTISLANYYAYLTASNYYALPGTDISFNGTGFASNEDIDVKVASASVVTLHTDASGTVTANTVKIPFQTGGDNLQFDFKGLLSGAMGNVKIGLAKFYSWVSMNNYYGPGGTAVTVSGAGFAAGEPININFEGIFAGSTSADNIGSFSLSTNVPFATEGMKAVKAIGQWSGATAQTTFTQAPVYVSVWLGGYASAPGTQITFMGSGYLANEPIQILTDRTGSTVVHSFTADASGNLNNSGYTIQNDFTEGNLELTIKGLNSMTEKTITYYVTGN